MFDKKTVQLCYTYAPVELPPILSIFMFIQFTRLKNTNYHHNKPKIRVSLREIMVFNGNLRNSMYKSLLKDKKITGVFVEE